MIAILTEIATIASQVVEQNRQMQNIIAFFQEPNKFMPRHNSPTHRRPSGSLAQKGHKKPGTLSVSKCLKGQGPARLDWLQLGLNQTWKRKREWESKSSDRKQKNSLDVTRRKPLSKEKSEGKIGEKAKKTMQGEGKALQKKGDRTNKVKMVLRL